MPTLLLVDDDDRFRLRLARAMVDRGHEVLEADSAEAALSRDVESCTHAVVDLRMPGEGGLVCIKALHARCPGLFILMLTGYGSIATTVEAIKQGASHCIAKPADADEILHALGLNEGFRDQDSDLPYDLAPSLARAEWEHIHRVLHDCQGNISKAARILGVHRRSLQRKLQKDPPKT